MSVHGYKQDFERQDYSYSQRRPEGHEGHELPSTLENVDTHLADQSIITPIAYILTEKDFL